MRLTSRRLLCALVSACTVSTAFGALPPLHNNGPAMVDVAGKPVLLKGCNLGNTLMLESWMFGGTLILDGKPFADQATLYRALRQRFGDDKFDHLVDVYRTSYITARDFDTIKSFGFNMVRLPFDYRLLQSDTAPYALKADAFKYLDHVVQLAADAGVYVMLDLHGTPGGQSGQDHTGESGQNHLWYNAVNRGRTVSLWHDLSEHYKNNPTVAAYDLINEPYGDYHTDMRPELATLMPAICKAIRSTGDGHVIFFSGALNGGVSFYGDPTKQGMTGVGFTEHYYPGLYGSPTNLATQARTLNGDFPAKAAQMKALGIPYFVGEFNIVEKAEWPERVMRAYYDRYAEYGWLGTMWSYKLIKTDGGAQAASWYMATNAEPLPKVDAATASYEEIESFFASLATTPIAVNEPLRDMLTTATPPPLYLDSTTSITTVPTKPSTDPAGYTSVDIGTAPAGHTATTGEKVTLLAGGADINGVADALRFVSRPAGNTPEEKITILSLPETNQWTKAGVMARWGTEPGSAMAMINAFPDGTIALISRPTAGGPTIETKGAAVAFPVELRLAVQDGKATAATRSPGGQWQSMSTIDVPSDPNLRIGLAACSHVDGAYTAVKAVMGPAADAALVSSDSSNGSTIAMPNATLERNADGWSRWGAGVSAAEHGVIYEPAKANNDSTGLWQDVAVTPGHRLTLGVSVSPFTGDDAAVGTMELRLESVMPQGEVTLNSKSTELSQLTAARELHVSGTAQSDKVRVLVIFNPTSAGKGKVGVRGVTLRDIASTP